LYKALYCFPEEVVVVVVDVIVVVVVASILSPFHCSKSERYREVVYECM
jgi:hypothetical protein